MGLLESFWFAPGFTKHFIDELRQMLFEELDFAREALFTDLFHRSTQGTEVDFATSPKVYFGLSNNEVLVTEFHTGIFLTELISAVENKDEAALEALREHDIDPTVVAKRLIWVSRFGGFEALFFHADLHPGNVLVKPGNELVLIDFGSCGVFTERERVVWRRVLYRFLDSMSVEYSHLQSKLSSFLASLGQAIYTLCSGAVVATAAVAMTRLIRSGPDGVHLVTIVVEVVSHDLFLIFTLLVGLVFVRRWWYRIE